jgi:oligoendopeptidase F
VSPSQLPHWNLETALSPDGDVSADDHESRLFTALNDLDRFFRAHAIGAGPQLACSAENVALFDSVIEMASDVVEARRVVALYWAGRCWADGTDHRAASRYARLQRAVSRLPLLLSDLMSWAGRFPPGELCRVSGLAAEHRYWLDRAQTTATHALPSAEEDLLAILRSSTAPAWQRLHNDLLSHLTADLGGKSMSYSALRSLRSDADRDIRAAAHGAGLAALASIEIPAAACLCAIRGETLALCARRRWANPLSMSLNANGIDQEVLDLVHTAVEYLLPVLWRFTKAKASMLGYQRLPAWEIAAPLPGEEHLEWTRAVDLVTQAASGFSTDFSDLVCRAVEDNWIDAADRDGKRQTALSMPMHNGESRLLVNFDGSVDSILSLAHELGHSYHYYLLRESPELQRIPPLGLAETASLFSESLLLATANRYPARDRIIFLNADLIGHFQVVVDTYSRFLFETDLTNRLQDGPLTPAEISELMVSAQKRAYGDSVDPETLDRYSWITKPHYYDPAPFTNWPYYFGLLLSLGLIDSADFRDEAPRSQFLRLLAQSGSADPVSLARECGIDLRSDTFWMRAARQLENRVNDFVTLVARHATLVG